MLSPRLLVFITDVPSHLVENALDIVEPDVVAGQHILPVAVRHAR